MGDTNIKYEELIHQDKALSKLLIDKEIDQSPYFLKYNYTSDFQAYISERYLGAFQEVYQRCMDSNQKEELIPLLESVAFLGNQEVRDKVVQIILPEVKRAAKDLEAFTEYIIDEQILIQQKELFDSSLTPLTILMINMFGDHQAVEVRKESILISCVGMRKSLSRAKPQTFPVKHSVYKTIEDSLERIDHDRDLENLLFKYKARMKVKRQSPKRVLSAWILFFTLVLAIVKAVLLIIDLFF